MAVDVGFATGEIVANSIGNTPVGGFTLKRGRMKITFDPSSPLISCNDGNGNIATIGGTNPGLFLNDKAGNSNNQNADSITLRDNSGATIYLQPASLQLQISDPSGKTARLQPDKILLGGITSGNLELDAPDVAGFSVQKFLPASGNIAVETNAPAAATSVGVTGQIAFDSNFFYVCVATNTWVRTALVTF